jgi:hypothetical protein
VIELERIKKWVEPKKLKSEERYEEEKKEFEHSIGEPVINIRIVIPEGLKNQRAQFQDLEKDQQFLEEVRDLVKKRLVIERHETKP